MASNEATPIQIRDALPSDAEHVARIYIESWNAGFVGLFPHREFTPQDIVQWRRDIGKPAPHRWWVAEVDGKIAGFAGICPSRDPIDPSLGELDTIAVDPPCWRMGIGRKLMPLVLKHLVADGYKEAILWTLANYNQGQRFYEAMGWKLDGGTRREGTQVRYRHKLVMPPEAPSA
jgi:N-acetylglutamate synthase-like GNAT family acetyltransferase